MFICSHVNFLSEHLSRTPSKNGIPYFGFFFFFTPGQLVVSQFKGNSKAFIEQSFLCECGEPCFVSWGRMAKAGSDSLSTQL